MRSLNANTNWFGKIISQARPARLLMKQNGSMTPESDRHETVVGEKEMASLRIHALRFGPFQVVDPTSEDGNLLDRKMLAIGSNVPESLSVA